MAVLHRRPRSPGSQAYIEDLISSLHSAVGHTRRVAVSSHLDTKKTFTSLLDLQAFQSEKFTDSEKYRQGRSTLASHGAKELKDMEAASVQKFTDLMAFDRSASQPRVYLSRELLTGKDTKAAFRRYRRRFGEVDQCFLSPVPKKNAPNKVHLKHVSPLPSKRADTNKFVIHRMGRILRSNSSSKESLLLRSAGHTPSSMSPKLRSERPLYLPPPSPCKPFHT